MAENDSLHETEFTGNKKTFKETVKALNGTFWTASAMELFERWAWYGIYTLFGLYLVGSTDAGGLGFNHIQKGAIMGNIVGILYFLPLFFGEIADRIGYRLSLIIAFVIMAFGYYFLGEAQTYGSVYALFLLVAVGAALFKPVASGIVARVTDESTGTVGFGVFYMMVNIGGFIGPSMSSVLRTHFGWKIIFIQAASVIFINLLIALFVFKEPKIEKPKESLGTALINSILNIFNALKDIRLSLLLLLMVGFWTMFNQLFNTLPNFIEDWVDSSAASNWLNEHLPFIASGLTENGLVKPEWFTNIDSLMIIFFQIFISYQVTKMRHISAVIRGAIIASIGVGLTFYHHSAWFAVIGTMIFAIGEMMSSPTVSSFIALITPKGKEALYQGTYFLPVAASYFVTSFISGELYQSWSDKLSLLQKEMDHRGLEMPKVITENQFIEDGAKALNMPITDFENKFDLKVEKVDWASVGDSFKEFAAQKGIDVSNVSLPFSKNEYFSLAEQKLGMDHWQMVEMLWNNYHPNKIWIVIFGIGIFSVITLWLYDRFIIRPREKKLQERES